jgi:transposase-like protein
MMKHFDSLFEMMEAFPDEQACIDHLRSIRWKNGAFCPHCGSSKVYHFSDRRNHKCGDCRKRFSIKVGTIFEDSKIELRTWMMAVWMLTSHKKGIASTTLARDLGVTQKTAWFMLHRLRYAAQTKSSMPRLRGRLKWTKPMWAARQRTVTRAIRRTDKGYSERPPWSARYSGAEKPLLR